MPHALELDKIFLFATRTGPARGAQRKLLLKNLSLRTTSKWC